MTDRHIIIESPARLHLRDGQIVISSPDSGETTVPVEDIASLLVESQEATISIPALNALTESNVAVTFCDARHSPASMLLALHANSLQTERFSAQLSLPQERKDELWKQIIAEKIRKQADLLDLLSLDGTSLRHYAEGVLPGDSTNKEGAAARIYWKELFGREFKRDRFGDGPNPLLNYGYSILRSAVARSLMSSGLFPCQGLHHKNRYNDLPLADDLMEPFRPFVDLKVYRLWSSGKRKTDRTAKTALQEVLLGSCSVKGHTQTIGNAMAISAASLMDCINGKKEQILFPLLD